MKRLGSLLGLVLLTACGDGGDAGNPDLDAADGTGFENAFDAAVQPETWVRRGCAHGRACGISDITDSCEEDTFSMLRILRETCANPDDVMHAFSLFGYCYTQNTCAALGGDAPPCVAESDALDAAIEQGTAEAYACSDAEVDPG